MRYDKLWEYLKADGSERLTLGFDDIEAIIGATINHAFLNAKKDAEPYGYSVGKISLKNKTIDFVKKN